MKEPNESRDAGSSAADDSDLEENLKGLENIGDDRADTKEDLSKPQSLLGLGADDGQKEEENPKEDEY